MVPALIATLQDPANSSGSSTSAISAVYALGSLRQTARAAVPALSSAVQSTNFALKIAAIGALYDIDPEADAKAGVK